MGLKKKEQIRAARRHWLCSQNLPVSHHHWDGFVEILRGAPRSCGTHTIHIIIRHREALPLGSKRWYIFTSKRILLSSNWFFSHRTDSSLIDLIFLSSNWFFSHRTDSSLIELILLSTNWFFSHRTDSSLSELILLSSNLFFSHWTDLSIIELILLSSNWFFSHRTDSSLNELILL